LAILADLSTFLKSSIYTPQMEADPSYIAIIADVDNIFKQVVKEMEYSAVEDVPSKDEGFLILLAKKEVYWRLAMATAPNYDLETEFTKLVKSKRFDHYFKLVAQIQLEIDKALPSISVADVTLRSREGSMRNYNLAKSITTGITVSGITQNSVNLDWIAYDIAKGTFVLYDVLISKVPIYDEYSDPIVDYGKAEQRITLTDVKRTKYRVINLTANTTYYLTLVYRALSGVYYTSEDFTTLA